MSEYEYTFTVREEIPTVEDFLSQTTVQDNFATSICEVGPRTIEVRAAEGAAFEDHEWESIESSDWYVSGTVPNGVELTRKVDDE